MKLRNLFIGLASFLILGSAYAILQPNIASRGSAVTSLDPTTYYLMVQSGTSQSHITAENFANSITGSIGLSSYLLIANSGDYYDAHITGDLAPYLLLANSGDYYSTNPSGYLTTGTMPSLDYLPLAGNTTGTAMSGWIYINGNYGLRYGDTTFIDLDSSSAELYFISGSDYGQIKVDEYIPTFEYNEGATNRSVTLGTGGLVYGADYSGDYTDRSLIDKGFLGSKFSNLTTTYVPFWSGTEFYNTNATYSGSVLRVGGGIISGITGLALDVSGATWFSRGATKVGGFIIDDVLGKNIGVYGGITDDVSGASVYGQTNIGTALYGEATGTGTALIATSSNGIGASIQGVTTGLIVGGIISALSGVYDAGGNPYITGAYLPLAGNNSGNRISGDVELEYDGDNDTHIKRTNYVSGMDYTLYAVGGLFEIRKEGPALEGRIGIGDLGVLESDEYTPWMYYSPSNYTALLGGSGFEVNAPISAMSGIYDAGGISYITGGALAGYVTIANSGTYFNANSGTYFNSAIAAYKPRTGVITYPGDDNYCPSTKAVVDYISGFNTLESVITTGAYILSGNTSVVACLSGQGQVGMSGGCISSQICSGTVWVEVTKSCLP